MTALHEQNQTSAEIADALNREGFQAPKRCTTLTAGMVRRLLDELRLRPRVSRVTSAAGEWWLHELARHLSVSPHTLHVWRKKGWTHARQLNGRRGPRAV